MWDCCDGEAGWGHTCGGIAIDMKGDDSGGLDSSSGGQVQKPDHGRFGIIDGRFGAASPFLSKQNGPSAGWTLRLFCRSNIESALDGLEPNEHL